MNVIELVAAKNGVVANDIYLSVKAILMTLIIDGEKIDMSYRTKLRPLVESLAEDLSLKPDDLVDALVAAWQVMQADMLEARQKQQSGSFDGNG